MCAHLNEFNLWVDGEANVSLDTSIIEHLYPNLRTGHDIIIDLVAKFAAGNETR